MTVRVRSSGTGYLPDPDGISDAMLEARPAEMNGECLSERGRKRT